MAKKIHVTTDDQRRAGRVPVRSPAEPARGAARHAASDRRQGRLQQRQLRRLHRAAGRSAGRQLPGAGRGGRRRANHDDRRHRARLAPAPDSAVLSGRRRAAVRHLHARASSCRPRRCWTKPQSQTSRRFASNWRATSAAARATTRSCGPCRTAAKALASGRGQERPRRRRECDNQL